MTPKVAFFIFSLIVFTLDTPSAEPSSTHRFNEENSQATEEYIKKLESQENHTRGVIIYGSPAVAIALHMYVGIENASSKVIYFDFVDDKIKHCGNGIIKPVKLEFFYVCNNIIRWHNGKNYIVNRIHAAKIYRFQWEGRELKLVDVSELRKK